jgi:hypothetical protein
MGILLSNFRRRVTAEFNGKKVSSLETVAGVKNGTLLEVTTGVETGSRTDGSQYVVAHVQIQPGTVIRVAGYGAEQIEQIRAVKLNGEFSALLSPMGRGGYKLVEFDTPVAAPGPQLVQQA